MSPHSPRVEDARLEEIARALERLRGPLAGKAEHDDIDGAFEDIDAAVASDSGA